MIYIETLMLAIIVYGLCIATITDFKKGVIPNRLLLGVGGASIVLDLVYYILFYRSGIGQFLSNFLCIFFLAIFFYALEIWAAGDSKLLIIVALGIPSRLYTFIPITFCPIFVLVMIVFSTAFLYSAIETVIRSVKEKRKIWKEFGTQFSIKKVLYFVITAIFMVSAILICNITISWLLSKSEDNYVLLILAIDFVCTLILIEIRKKINIKKVTISGVIMLIITVVFYCLGFLNLSFGSGGMLSVIVMLVTIVVRMLAGKYNYQEIAVEKLTSNMILSMGTSMRMNMTFQLERPLPMTENRKARLTQEQVESIKKNAEKAGWSSVMIVRKLPFAIFIFVGTILFLGLEAAYVWFI